MMSAAQLPRPRGPGRRAVHPRPLRPQGPAANLSVGEHTFISGSAEIVALDTVTIGSRVVINDRVTILTASHHVGRPGLATFKKPVRIEDYAWIAVGATILPGVTIGYGAVVGAGAVVAKDVPPLAVATGNPADDPAERPAARPLLRPGRPAACLSRPGSATPSEIRQRHHRQCARDAASSRGHDAGPRHPPRAAALAPACTGAPREVAAAVLLVRRACRRAGRSAAVVAAAPATAEGAPVDIPARAAASIRRASSWCCAMPASVKLGIPAFRHGAPRVPLVRRTGPRGAS